MSILDRGGRGNVQNPFTSGTDAFSTGYSNPRMPTNFQGNVGLALNYLFDAVYPDYKGTVPTKADLPATAGPNDFYLVMDDGDGKSAGYVWTVTSASSSWIKRYDVDWSYEQILSETNTRAGYMYAAKYGLSDRDALGNVITGLYSGQRFYGGAQTGENLTLTANFFDASGFVQTDNTIRPTLHNSVDVGTAALAFREAFFGTQVNVGTLSIGPASILDSTGSISFGGASLQTSANVSANRFISGTLSLQSGSISDSSGTISFGSTALTTNGAITGATGSKLSDITFSSGTFSTTSGAGFSFSNQNVSNVSQLTSSKVIATEVDSGNLILSGQTVSTNSSATALYLQSGSGGNATQVQINSKTYLNFDLQVTGLINSTASGINTFTGSIAVGSGLSLYSLTTNGYVTSGGDLNLFSSGNIIGKGSILPDADTTRSLGSSSLRYSKLFVSNGISDGTNTVSVGTLTSLRNMNTGAADKNVLYYDAASGTWKPENLQGTIDHTSLLNLTLGDAGHTQFAMLQGRSGGQTIFGDTAASGSLVLASTSNATKGFVLFADSAAPSSDAIYSSGWTGISLGSPSRNFNNIYAKGIFFGLRFDQYAGSGNYPTSSGQNIGRVIWDTSLNQLLVDTGSAWAKVGSQKLIQDISFDGVQTSQTVTVSASISDARTAIFQLLDNQNNFEQIFARITKTQTQITITASPALPSGSYRLIGIN